MENLSVNHIEDIPRTIDGKLFLTISEVHQSNIGDIDVVYHMLKNSRILEEIVRIIYNSGIQVKTTTGKCPKLMLNSLGIHESDDYPEDGICSHISKLTEFIQIESVYNKHRDARVNKVSVLFTMSISEARKNSIIINDLVNDGWLAYARSIEKLYTINRPLN
jgi:hypothetical protein